MTYSPLQITEPILHYLYDTALCLFNATAQLNIRQSPRFENEIRNKIKDYREYEDVKSSLDNIKSKVQQNRTPRNSFVHSGKNPSHEDLALISTADMFNFGSQNSHKENEGTIRKRKMDRTGSYQRVEKRIGKKTEEICHLILVFFSALQPIYEQNLANHR